MTSDDMAEYDAEQRAEYRRLRDLRRAEQVRVDADAPGIVLTYTLDGQEHQRTVLPEKAEKQ